jgi:predicted tellurium resistance membrane protein TerC
MQSIQDALYITDRYKPVAPVREGILVMLSGLALALATMLGYSRRIFQDEQAQDTFEYIVIIGVVIVTVVAAAFLGVGENLIDFVIAQTSGTVSNMYNSVP